MHGGQAILKAFERSGIDFILSSPGSEWPPVWEALAEQKRIKYTGSGFYAMP